MEVIFCAEKILMLCSPLEMVKWGKRRERSRKIVAYSDTVSAMLIFSSFTDDNMILQAIAVHDTFIIILSQYIVFINACHTLHAAHLVVR